MEKAVLIAGNALGVSNVNADGLKAPDESKGVEYYVIKSGDTLSAIAQHFYKDPNKYPKIFEANREVIKDPNLIFPGQKIAFRRPERQGPAPSRGGDDGLDGHSHGHAERTSWRQ